ncbi:MAG: transposase [Hydrogenophaga sp.]|jgi:transposase
MRAMPRANWPAKWVSCRPVLPSPKRREPWALDKALYRRRNEVERLFRRLKAWRRVFTRYDKTDVMFAAFITVVLTAEALR